MYRSDIKLMAFVASAMFWGSGALANDVYMEQVGDNTSVTVNQTGAGNSVEGVDLNSPAFIGGDGNIVSITQIGVSNVLKLSVGTSNIGGAGSGVTVTATADGSSNTQTINCSNSIAANCAATTITSNISGDSNTVTQNITGNGLSSIINVTGNGNTVGHTTSGAGAHTGNITVDGGSNNVALVQSGGLAKSATITHTGSNNTINVTQSD